MPALVGDSLSYAEAERLVSAAAWPCTLVEDGCAPTGFVTPVIPAEFFIELTAARGVSSSTAEFQHLRCATGLTEFLTDSGRIPHMLNSAWT
jgi:eukaryotic-like serine/threonine-protein kinase